MTTPSPTDPTPRFWPLFAIALACGSPSCVLLGLVRPRPGRPIRLPGPADADALPRPEIVASLRAGDRAVVPLRRVWFANVALNGYASGRRARGSHLGAAFMPAMPATMAAADALGLNPFWAGLLAANLVAAAGTAVFARVAARLTDDRARACARSC